MTPKDFEKLNNQLISIESFIEAYMSRKITPSVENPQRGEISPLGNITPDVDLTQFSQERLHLLHSMLHLFYSNKSGKGLNESSIVKLHNRLKESLSCHQFFDKLDFREEI